MRLARNGQRRGAPSGERHPLAKLTQAQVDEMRRLRAEGVARRRLVERYGVCLSRVTAITTRKAWRQHD